jgi:hypothetical protein
MSKLSEQEKTEIADRIMKELEREMLDYQWLFEQVERSVGAAKAHYKRELEKMNAKIAGMKDELRALGRLN